MKKILLMALTAIAFQTTRAQKVAWGLTAGTNFANQRWQDGTDKDNSGYHVGFTTGVFADIGLSKSIFLQPSLNFVQKGGQESNSDDLEPEIKAVLNVNYLEMPLNVLFKTGGSAGQFFIGGGPSLAYALSGKQKLTGQGTTISEKIKFGSTEDDDMKAFDVGANFLLGYQFKSGVSLSSNYTLGLSNLSPYPDSKTRNSCFAVKLGYQF